MYKSCKDSPVSSIIVIQFALTTVWAGSCPVAMKMAATTLAAWAFCPPMLPASADPIKFLLMLTSTKASAVVFKVCEEIEQDGNWQKTVSMKRCLCSNIM